MLSIPAIQRCLLLACIASLMQDNPGVAQSVRLEPSLRVSVEGASAATQVLNLTDLASLRNVSFETSTIWTVGTQNFTGVPLRDLLSATLLPEAPVPGTVIRVIALNQYFADIPLESLQTNVPILAFQIDGQPFSIRDKGPFWVVYPYDSGPEYMSEEVYSRSVWQVSEIVVRLP